MEIKQKKLHFVGIGGVSMSALAKFALAENCIVTGTEKSPNNFTEELKKLGIKINKTKNSVGVKNCDLLVFSGAVNENHPDLLLAKKLGKKILERPQFLNLVSQKFNTTIAVSGTHGKTTTTAMIAKVLNSQNPTVHIGGKTKEFGNLKLGSKNIFVTEACEYKKSFLTLKPNISVVLNIEPDHMDCFKSKQNLINSFQAFVKQTTDFAIINHDFLSFFKQNFAKSKIVSFGFSKKADFFADNLTEKNGKFCFNVFHKKLFLGNIKLNVAGKHNVLNALVAVILGHILGQNFEETKKQLKNFCMPQKRFEILMQKPFLLVRDYAHHPTEIKQTLITAKSISKQKIFCVFQPHTFSRTKFLFSEFLTCFNLADEVVFLPTFSAREKASAGTTSFQLFSKLKHPKKHYFKNLKNCFNFLKTSAKKGSTILFVGAGSISDFALDFTNFLT